MMLSSVPAPPLRQYVSRLWTSSGSAKPDALHVERVMPSGSMHIVLRLGREPLILLNSGQSKAVSPDVIGGVRSSSYDKLAGLGGPTIGASLCIGAAEALFGVPADEMYNRHIPLEDVWSVRELTELRERLMETSNPEVRLSLFGKELTRRVRDAKPTHPLITHTLAGLRRNRSVIDLAQDAGLSHKTLARHFRRAAGLGPKAYQRLLRFNRALVALHGDLKADLAQISLGTGFSDQAHFCREFRDFANMTPSMYVSVQTREPRHVRFPSSYDFVQDHALKSA